MSRMGKSLWSEATRQDLSAGTRALAKNRSPGEDGRLGLRGRAGNRLLSWGVATDKRKEHCVCHERSTSKFQSIYKQPWTPLAGRTKVLRCFQAYKQKLFDLTNLIATPSSRHPLVQYTTPGLTQQPRNCQHQTQQPVGFSPNHTHGSCHGCDMSACDLARRISLQSWVLSHGTGGRQVHVDPAGTQQMPGDVALARSTG
ncbi:hypothetical protein CPAR01_01881 [Colletotrichum paranaense]|uniref:Uncharacterized protein n=1 Tax=Colletotrichum paranaense TaxID=1914294 RepID=A0ABQ9SY33_9PEZI|nr:uncharacterized protein CPAR01_01881 [Colletotrichum paranaense]KAK1544379.1 hypothetical protein CPAR01_01881 [Colletotrichum paranaense]